MAQFASIWAIKDRKLHNDGDTIEVSLKSGAVKPVTIDRFLYSQEAKDGTVSYYYLAAPKS